MLEMFTGRRPTNDIFKDGLNLHTFVQNALPERLAQIADPTVVVPSELRETEMADGQDQRHNNNAERLRQMNDGDHMQSCLHAVLKMALGCSMESPGDRINMVDVTRELQHIRKAFLSVRGR